MPDTFQSFPPVSIANINGLSPVILVCEHASDFIPEKLDDLGLSKADRQSHAAWDPGARELSRALSKNLDAVLIEGCISRLVYDCNRPPDAPSAFPTQSERIVIPGNEALSVAERTERTEGIYNPFRMAVQTVLDSRRQTAVPPIVVTIHSFTPVYFGEKRTVEIGILHDDDASLAQAMMQNGDCLPARNVVLNQPYDKTDGVTHSLAIYGTANGLLNVMLEVRNDLLTTEIEIEAMAQDLSNLLLPAIYELGAHARAAQQKVDTCQSH